MFKKIITIILTTACAVMMLSFGVKISKDHKAYNDKIKNKYDNMLVIDDDPKLLEEMIKKSDGTEAFIHGYLRCKNPVSMENLNGEYLYIEKRYQEYVRKSRTSHSNGKTKRTYYHTWETKNTEEKYCYEFEICGRDFSAYDFKLPKKYYVSTYHHQDDKNKRDEFYVIDKEYEVTLLVKFEGKDVVPERGSDIKINVTGLEETRNMYMKKDMKSIGFFWFYWIIISALVCSAIFFILHNLLPDTEKHAF